MSGGFSSAASFFLTAGEYADQAAALSSTAAFKRAPAESSHKAAQDVTKTAAAADCAKGGRISLLASGSKGNAAYIELDGKRLLIDAGISARRITQSLKAFDVTPSSLDGIFITHEHSDHIKGLTTLLKQYHLPLFARPATLAAIRKTLDAPDDCFFPVESEIRLGDVTVRSFRTLHDAAAPVGYAVCGSEKCSVATDLGFLTDGVLHAIEGSDLLVLEANHDREMLQKGSYPRRLKQRILSNRGHLSNSAAAWALVRLKKRPRAVFLAHLSQENNRPDLALRTVQAILQNQGIEQENLMLGAQDMPMSFGFGSLEEDTPDRPPAPLFPEG